MIEWCVVLVLCSLARSCAGTSRLDSPEWKDSFDGAKHGDEAGRDAYLQKYGAWNRVNPAVTVLGQHNVVRHEEVIFESTGSSSNSNNNLNVDSLIDIHVCAHTHDDVGWTSTVFGYYNNSVQYILSSVMQALANNPSRRFIWSEIKWWEMWWPRQTPAMHDMVRRLVQAGQLEFVGAGWSQTDEVSASYRDMVDNAMTGHEFLRRTLGDACPGGRCVRYGWQIDMFSGYSATTPSLWAMMGYDGMVMRFEGPDDMRAAWGEEKAFQFLWEGSTTLTANRSQILTHSLRWNYGDMMDTCIPPACTDPSIAPTLSLGFSSWVLTSPAAIQAHAAALVTWARAQNSVFPSASFLAVWGGDFQFTNASMWFDQMDLLVREINGNPSRYNATIRYSTLTDYFAKLHSLKLSFPIKKYVNFEYGWPHTWLMGNTGNDTVQYQTGAPASRAAHKQHIRRVARLTRAAQPLHAFGLAHGALPNRVNDFMVAWDANGVCSHHDSIPGTMRSNVSTVLCPQIMPATNAMDACQRCSDPDCRVLEDYTARLDEAEAALAGILTNSLQHVAGTATPPALQPSLSTASIIVYNPLPHDRRELVSAAFVRPPGILTWPTVRDHLGQPIVAQMGVNDTLLAAQFFCTVSCPGAYAAPKFDDVVFFIAVVPALGLATYSLEFDALANSTTTVVPTITSLSANNHEISNEYLHVEFHPTSKLLQRVTTLGEGSVAINVTQTYWNYVDGPGGAYCLVEQSAAQPVAAPGRASVVVGPVFQQVSQTYTYGQGLLQRYRLVQGSALLTVHHVIGTLPGNRELVSKLDTDLASADILHYDASGFWELRSDELNATGPVSQNYHALVQTAMVREPGAGGRAVAVLVARTMGVASLATGSLEYMLLRRIVQGSDFQGPAPLDETESLAETLQLLFGPAAAVEAARFPRALELEHPLMVFYSDSNPGQPVWQPMDSQSDTLYMDLLVRHTVNASSSPPEYALRLQSFAPAGETAVLAGILRGLNVASCEEMTLTFLETRAANDAQRLVWSSAPPAAGKAVGSESVSGCTDTITLQPLDIRSFAILLK